MTTNQRAVKLRTTISAPPTGRVALATNQPVQLSFLSMGDPLPTASDYGVQEEAQVDQLNQTLQYLHSINDVFFQWLESDATHTILFANEPLTALRSVFPDFDTSFRLSANPFS
ncbi:hypothetical protein CLV58_13514 [Spirosoma oryzae]|uniref:Uncharacterized protein n=1 Tax=Spirosoma oryzae TaxID=1469603 RepID=A0A2T0S0W7_9BACT|nr:hypothetical protein [Spirosoma oryzae]PRY27012.1 hypothetical protein CLV58_13514 [Spirosoma oryzae]